MLSGQRAKRGLFPVVAGMQDDMQGIVALVREEIAARVDQGLSVSPGHLGLAAPSLWTVRAERGAGILDLFPVLPDVVEGIVGGHKPTVKRGMASQQTIRLRPVCASRPRVRNAKGLTV